MSNLHGRLQRLERSAAQSLALRRGQLLDLLAAVEQQRHADLRRRGEPVPRSLMPRLREQEPEALFAAAWVVLERHRGRRR